MAQWEIHGIRTGLGASVVLSCSFFGSGRRTPPPRRCPRQASSEALVANATYALMHWAGTAAPPDDEAHAVLGEVPPSIWRITVRTEPPPHRYWTRPPTSC